MVHKLRQEGVSSPLLWLQHCLNRTAADREEDGQAQPVPLVPLTEDNEDAMENKHFQRLLKKLGIRAPANEQESFWRIPAKLTPAQLRGCASSLCVSEEAPPRGSKEEEQGAEEQRAGALRALLLARKRKRPLPDAAGTEMESPAQPVKPALDSESESDSETSREPERRAARKQAAKRSRVLDSDEEEEEGSGKSSAMDLGGRDPDSDAEERTAPAKRRRHRIEDDDED